MYQAYGEYVTGQKAPTSGVYEYVRHTDGPPYCTPTANERYIPLSAGETFPPHKSCEKGVIWRFYRPA
jgi:hypothetical protein